MKKIIISIFVLLISFINFNAFGEEYPVKLPPKETIIFMPSYELETVISKEKEGIFMPYEEYRDLFKKAQNEFSKLQKAEESLFLAPLITSSFYQGVLRDDVISFKAKFTIIQSENKPCSLPIPLKNVNLRNAFLNGKSVQLYEKDSLINIIIPEKGCFELILDFIIPAEYLKTDESNTKVFKLSIPKTEIGEIKIQTPSLYDVAFDNTKFAYKNIIHENNLEFCGFIGGLNDVSIQVKALSNFNNKGIRLYSNEKHEIKISKNTIETLIDYDLNVKNGSITNLEIKIPKDVNVYSIESELIDKWSISKEASYGKVKIYFLSPIEGKTSFKLYAYKYLADSSENFSIEDIMIENIFERKGKFLLYYSKEIRFKIIGENNLILSPLGVDKKINSYKLIKAYEICSIPYSLNYKPYPVISNIESSAEQIFEISSEKIMFTSKILLQGFENSLSEFNFSYPNNFFLIEAGVKINGLEFPALYEIADGKIKFKTKNTVSFGDKAEFNFKLEKILIDGDKKNIKEEIPQIFYENALKNSGKLNLIIDDALIIQDIAMLGYSAYNLKTDDTKANKKKLYYEFQDEIPLGTIMLTKKEPELSSQTICYFTVDEDIAQVNAFINYNVSNGAVKSVYLAVEQFEGSFIKENEINITGNFIKEKKIITKDAFKTDTKISLPESILEVWEVLFEKEQKENFILEIDFKGKIKDGNLFKPPLILPLNVIHDNGYIVVEAGKTTDIKIQSNALDKAEIFELPDWPPYSHSNRVIDIFRYFRRPFDFKIQCSKKKELPLLSAYIEHENISYTISEFADYYFEYEYDLYNTNLQFLDFVIPKDYEIFSAEINGKGVKIRKSKEGRLLLSLPFTNKGEKIKFFLKGSIPSKHSSISVFKCRSIDFGVPVLKSSVNVYYPDSLSILSKKDNYPLIFYISNSFAEILFKIVNVISLPGCSLHKSFYMHGEIPNQIQDEFQKMNEPQKQADMDNFRQSQRGMLEKELSSETIPPRPPSAEIAGLRPLDKPSILLKSEPKPEEIIKLHEKKTMPKKSDLKAKGILSIEFSIPKQGISFYMSKLWKGDDLKLVLISNNLKNFFRFIILGLTFVLGFFLDYKKIVSPFVFFVSLLIVFTLLPQVFLKNITFIFNSAIIGSFIFICFYFALKMVKVLKPKFLGKIILILVLFLSAVPYLFAEDSFPSVKIYIPYNDENIPSGISGTENVFIPYKDYFNLKFIAEPPYDPSSEFKYKNEYDIVSFKSKGVLENERIKFTGKINIFLNYDKWQLVNLPFEGILIDSFKVDGKIVPINISVEQPEKAYQIPIIGKGLHVIEVSYEVPASSKANKKTVDFKFPKPLITDFSIIVNDENLVFDITEPKKGYFINKLDSFSEIVISPLLSNHIQFSWMSKQAGLEDKEAFIYCNSEVNLFIGYDGITIKQNNKIRIEKSSLMSLSFLKPDDLNFLELNSNAVNYWEIKNINEKSMISVDFKNETKSEFDISFLSQVKTDSDKKLPEFLILPFNADRIEGILNIYCKKGLNILVEDNQNLTMSELLDSSNVYSEFTLKKRYSFSDKNIKAKIYTTKEEPKKQTNLFYRYIVSENRLYLNMDVILDIESSLFLSGLSFKCPLGYIPFKISGKDTSDFVFDDKTSIVYIPFSYSVENPYKLRLSFEKKLDSLNNLSIESVIPIDSDHVAGKTVIEFPNDYDVLQKNTENLTPIPHDKDLSNTDLKNKIYYYRLNNKNFTASFEISSKETLINAIKVNFIDVHDSSVEIKSVFNIEVKDATPDNFIIKVPLELKDSLQIKGDWIKNIQKKQENGFIFFTINNFDKTNKNYTFEVSALKYFANDNQFSLPKIILPQASKIKEYIVVNSSTIYKVNSFPSDNLREIDKDKLPHFFPIPNTNSILWTFKCPDDEWHYNIHLNRLEREEMVQSEIQRLDIKTLIISDGVALSEVKIKIKNKNLQFLPLLIPDSSEIWTLNVKGEPFRPSYDETNKIKNGKKAVFIPLIKGGIFDRSFEIKILLQIPVNKFGRIGKNLIDLIIIDGIPVEKTTWTFHLPYDYYYKFKTNMYQIDYSTIEAEKTLELAKELAYWSNMAETSGGKAQNMAVENKIKVFNEYNRKKAEVEQLQQNVSNKIEHEKNKELKQTRDQNLGFLREADNLVQSNVPQSKVSSEEYSNIDMDSEKKEKKKVSGKASLDISGNIQRQSIILKGTTSMDIDIPEWGRKISFEKLGGDPYLSFSYLKKDSLKTIFIIFIILGVIGISVKYRNFKFSLNRHYNKRVCPTFYTKA
ncbi:MAG: hypothetical protein HQK76_06160 [Desulfobacterales bacterium]|nr:hypothetical protein [Desulfobacterales bacterium]